MFYAGFCSDDNTVMKSISYYKNAVYHTELKLNLYPSFLKIYLFNLRERGRAHRGEGREHLKQIHTEHGA